MKGHAGIPQAIGDDAADPGAQRTGERRRVGIDQPDGQAEIAAAGGCLAADQAGADDEDAGRSLGQRGSQAGGIVPSAQGEDPVEPAAGCGRPGARLRAGGDEEAIVGEYRSIREADHPRIPVEGDGPMTQAPVGIEGDEFRQSGGIRCQFARQNVLRQRRPVVGTVRFITHDREPPGVAVAAQSLRAAEAGERCADDDESGRFPGAHGVSPRSACRLMARTGQACTARSISLRRALGGAGS
jgi:hypothetical protein